MLVPDPLKHRMQNVAAYGATFSLGGFADQLRFFRATTHQQQGSGVFARAMRVDGPRGGICAPGGHGRLFLGKPRNC